MNSLKDGLLFKYTVPLGLALVFVLKWEFLNFFVGPFGLIRAQGICVDYKCLLVTSSWLFTFLTLVFLASIGKFSFGKKSVWAAWAAFFSFFLITLVIKSEVFPLYLLQGPESLMIFPFLLTTLFFASPFEREPWLIDLIIIYVIMTYFIPLLARAPYFYGWIDGLIVESLFAELGGDQTSLFLRAVRFSKAPNILGVLALLIEFSSLFLISTRCRPFIAIILCGFHLIIGIFSHVITYSIVMIALIAPLVFYEKRILFRDR